MIAVTVVNGCRYCSYFHAKMALKVGLEQREIQALLSGEFSSCPEDEAIGIAYAQHWAGADAHPDPEAVQRLQQTYGTERADAIHLILRMIRMGNLTGNTLDYMLYRLSFGLWGGSKPTQG